MNEHLFGQTASSIGLHHVVDPLSYMSDALKEEYDIFRSNETVCPFYNQNEMVIAFLIYKLTEKDNL